MRMRTLLLLVIVAALSLDAQVHPSIHQAEAEYYRDNPGAVGVVTLEKSIRRADLAGAKALNSVVYGFHPYWQNGSESNYYFSLLTHLAYFSGEIDPATGGFTTTRSWSTASVISTAQQYGVKVHFTVTLFSGHATLLNSATNRSNLIANIISQINLRNADGCNVDFEAVGAANAATFRSFIFDLGTALKAEGKELVVELPAVDWSGVYTSTFFSTTGPVVDYYFLMAYDYYWSGSTTAGPVAPVTTGSSIRHVTRSFSAYLSVGCPAGKLIGGFPYYGYEWPVVSSLRMADVVAARGKGSSRTYTALRSLLPGIASGDKFSDATYNVPWYRYDSAGTGLWRQGWYDDEISLARKYDSVKAYGLAGAGMWALGYDGAYPELWTALKNAFASTPNAAHTSLDAFETGVGRFSYAPTYSGSTSGISTSSTAVWSNDRANNGQGSLAVTLIDNTSATTNWSVRLVSGGGAIANNVTLSEGGYIGFWMRTTSAPPGAQVGMLIDDSAGGTEKSPLLNVSNDGNWHLYEFNTVGPGWTSFAYGDGSVDGPTFTLDAIYFSAPDQGNTWALNIDDVSYNSVGALPIQLLTFSAQPLSTGIRLEWATATELDNYGFDIERRAVSSLSATRSEWRSIGFVTGAGTTSTVQQYTFRDPAPLLGRAAYRLRQIDRTGAYAYSGEVEVENSIVPADPMALRTYPNPFNPSTTVEFVSSNDGLATIRVFNLLGQQVDVLFEGELTSGAALRRTFDAKQLPSGIYIVRFEQAGHLRSSKLILSR